ncbi:hypothetical protein NHQ30_008653 [Ciborinia camelliae]|nr:hypothetical protein NHQ30_008653 [Ciborinia camelliae]
MSWPSAIQSLLWIGVSFIVYRTFYSFYVSNHNEAKAQELNCEEAPFERKRWPLGMDNPLRSLAADRSKLVPVDLVQCFNDLRTSTYRYQVLGKYSQLLKQSQPHKYLSYTRDSVFRFQLVPYTIPEAQL